MKDEYKHREVNKSVFMGEEVRFAATNDRLNERTSNLSHERHILQKLIELTNPDDVFWDVGACLGIHTFILAKHLPDGTVIGFEPTPSNRGVLMDNKSINQLSNVWIAKQALADENDTAEFAIRQSFNAGFGRHGLTTGDDKYEKLATIDVDTRKGSSLVIDGEVPPPNVVKIDAEGAGPLVLRGMKDVLSSDACHAIIFETHEPNPVQPSHEDFGMTRADIISFLEDCGFTVSTLQEEFHLLAEKDPEPQVTFEDARLDIELVQGDIADETADAIMNSAGTSLRMGTGVAGVLREKGGESVNDEALRQGPVEPGEAVLTSAGDLEADIIVHAASMPHHGEGRSTPETVRRAVSNALKLADEEGCESVVLPAVGCGLGGLSLATGTEIIGDVLREYTPTHKLATARVIAYTPDEYETMQNVLGLTKK